MTKSNFSKYQKQAHATSLKTEVTGYLAYPTLGLINETGEFAGKIKKIYRDSKGKISSKQKSDLQAELGDVLWYLAEICTVLDISLEDVAEDNLTKLASRSKRNKLKGSGDHR